MTGAILVGSLAFVFVIFLKNLVGRNWNGVVTQLIAWVAGYVAVLLAVHSGLASDVAVLGKTLGALNGFGQLVAGLMASSLFGVVQNGFKAVDTTQSEATPPFVSPQPPPPVA